MLTLKKCLCCSRSSPPLKFFRVDKHFVKDKLFNSHWFGKIVCEDCYKDICPRTVLNNGRVGMYHSFEQIEVMAKRDRFHKETEDYIKW